MMLLSVSSSFLLTILLSALSYKTHSAPTHHLTIGVQGNTPTLIVTSSEIDMTLQTKDSSKNIESAEYTTKSFKDTNTRKKSLKTKLNKNYTSSTKKDIIQHLTNPFTKQTLNEETSFKVMKSLKNKENVLKQPTQSTLKLDTYKITTTTSDALLTTGNVEIYKTNLQLTTSPTKLINNIKTSTGTPQINTIEPKEISTLPPRATTDLSSTLLTISDHDNDDDDSLNIPQVKSITLNPKEFHDIAITTIYNDDKTEAKISNSLTQMQTKSIPSNFVLQTQNITTILPDTSVIRTENDDDNNGFTQETMSTTENENLLSTTKPFTTPAAIYTPTLVTLITDNTEPSATTSELLSLSLTMTTSSTEKVVVDDNNTTNKNEQQQTETMYIEQSINGPTKESYAVESDKETDDDVIFKSRKDYMLTKTATRQNYVSQFKSTENPLQDKNIETTQESALNAITEKFPKNKIETITETETIPTTLLAVTEEQTISTLKTNQRHQEITTITPDPGEEIFTTTTTDGILKLIDLEKHVLKAIDELKNPSLLMTGQYDNGHDGLKSIKKKQLIDKHYVEALLHKEQDAPIKDSLKNKKYLPQPTQSTEKSTNFSLNSSHSTAASNKSMLTPIKHGYLGPILMEEKTFHVTHPADKNMTATNHHVDGIESQLWKGNFMELKARKEVKGSNEEEKINKNTNTNNESSSLEENKMLEMQSDQPVQILNKQNMESFPQNNRLSGSAKIDVKAKDINQVVNKMFFSPARIPTLDRKQESSSTIISTENKSKQIIDIKHNLGHQIIKDLSLLEDSKPEIQENNAENIMNNSLKGASNSKLHSSSLERAQQIEPLTKPAAVLSTTIFQVTDSVATKTPMMQADTLFTSQDKEKSLTKDGGKEQTESKISDIQIEIYDSTVDSIVAATNFKDIESKHQSLETQNYESYMGKTTKPPIAAIQQERFTQYVIDRMETSTHEPINFSTIQVGSGKPEPAAIEIHINVSESFGNESEDLEFSYPQTEYSDSNNNERILEESYDNNKGNDNIKLKISSNSNVNDNKELRNNEILVVEIIDNDNKTESSFNGKSKNTDELFITDVKEIYSTPPPPPPPPPYQMNFDRDSDTIFYISNTEVKVGESLPTTKNANEERKLKLESQFFPANYMASTHPNLKNAEDSNPTHHLYEEDIILSPSHNQADSLKIYRNNNEPSPPLDVTYVGESIIEVEQSPESVVTTTYAPDQQHYVATPQPDVIIQPAILPEISIGVPVIGELPPQIELKEIDFMPSEAQLHRSGIYYDNDNSNSNSNNKNNNNFFNNDIDENTINASNNNHDIDVVNGNSNSNQRVDESSIQYGGDLIDESADGGFDGVEGSYPFGNPALVGKTSPSSYTSAFLTKLRKQQKQQPNHVADYAHLYVNYGVNNMRKDELSADVKDSGEIFLVNSGRNGNGNANVASNEQNITSFKDFINKVSINNSTIPFMSVNSNQSERMSNATAFSVMEDINDLEEKNTEDIINLISLAIGLFIVILPVVVTCSMFWALRYLYKKYHSTMADNGGYADKTETKSALNEDCVEKGEFVHETSSSPTNSNKDTIEKYADTSNKPSTTDSNDIFKSEKLTPYLETSSAKTNTSIANTSTAIVFKKNETLKLSLPLTSPITQKQTKPPPSASSSALRETTTRVYIQTVHGDVDDEEGNDDDVEILRPNGSITKMTLENNLLIVETEERNDISRVARETKMDYNKDGVFVVEVARGIDSKTIPDSPVTEGNEKKLLMFDTKQNNGGLGYKMTNEKNCVNNEKVQIHSPPPENQEEGPRSLHQIEEVEEPTNSPHLNENNSGTIVGLSYKGNTGLSQSDLSSTSSCDSNKDYCYGNQQLYVVEQKVHSSATPTGNVYLKCDIKDIKDDDHNPENDHYLKHSPGKKEELNKDKQNIVETTEEPDGKGSRTSSGESPEQKQNDKIQEKVEISTVTGNIPELQDKEELNLNNIEKESMREHNGESNNITETDVLAKIETAFEVSKNAQNFVIPVEIEVHITPVEDEIDTEDTILSPNKTKETEKTHVVQETQNITQPLILEKIYEVVEDSVAVNSLHEEQEVIVNNKIDQINILATPDKFSDKDASQDDESPTKAIEEKEQCENIKQEDRETTSIENNKTKQNEEILNKAEEEHSKMELINGLETNGILDNNENGIMSYNSNSIKTAELEFVEENTTLNIKHEEENTELLNGEAQPELLTNSTTTLTELVTESKAQELQNGHAEIENSSSSLNETENGFDSIMSLPEPPPTTDEQPNSDLSDQQLDSLPPPPPPETFNLKDLPPPLSNGNKDSPQSEESTSFYNTLPPPPPTTLKTTVSPEMTRATNGNVHASPLTPPASPPAHFTNNLHAGLCSQPIAVDVNGS